MRKRTVSLIALAAGLVAVGGVAAKGAKSLFPLADGNRWTLQSLESTAVTTMSVRKTAAGLVLRGFPGAGDLRVRSMGLTVEAWDPRDGRWEALLRFGLRPGSKYTVDLGGTPLWRSVLVTVATTNAVVADAEDRAFRGVTRFTLRPPGKVADAGVLELAFAPGVGPVRIVEQTIAGPRTKLLSAYRVHSAA
jgi:hypothetical protein